MSEATPYIASEGLFTSKQNEGNSNYTTLKLAPKMEAHGRHVQGSRTCTPNGLALDRPRFN